MGKRLRVVKKHEEYGESAFFNWNFVDFHELLEVLSCEVNTREEDADYYAEDFECLKKDYEKAFEIVKFHKENGEGDELKKKIYDNAFAFATAKAKLMCNAGATITPDALMDDINETYDKYLKLIESLEGIAYVYVAMETFYKQCEQDYEYISFSAF